MIKRILVLVLALIMLIMSSCSSKVPQTNQANNASSNSNLLNATQINAQSLSVYPLALDMPIGRKLKIMATVNPDNLNIKWISDNEAVAVVSQDGILTAKGVGCANITAQAREKSATCIVNVVQEGITLVWPEGKPGPTDNPPPTALEGTDSQKAEGQETPKIPIEVPDDIIDVEVIPEIDEFVWSIIINDKFSTTFTNEGITLKVNFSMNVKATKVGGKTPDGNYTGTITCDADYDHENFLEVMNKNMTQGKIVDFQENDNGFTEKFNPVLTYFNIGITEKNYVLQAMGTLTETTTIQGSMTVEAGGQRSTIPFSGKSTKGGGLYILNVEKSGKVTLSIPKLQNYGATRYWSEGILCKCPMI